MTSAQAADLLNVDRASVTKAKAVLRGGTPEEITAMSEFRHRPPKTPIY